MITQLTWAERMGRYLDGLEEVEEHPKFYPAGRRFVWEPPKRSGLRPHRGMTGHWKKGGPPGTLIYCLDCLIRTNARKGATPEQINSDIRTWKSRHNRVAKAEITRARELEEQLVDYEKRRAQLGDVLKIQGAHGNWDYDGYMLGMFNGLELAASIMEGRTPEFRKKPEDGWLRDKPIAVRLETAEGTPSPGDPVTEAYMYEAAVAGEVEV